MNISQALPISPILPSPNCWQTTVSSVTSTWDTIWEKGSLFIHAITWIFFRAVATFSPGVVAIEVLLCHGIAIIQNMRSNSRLSEIKTLTDKNLHLLAANEELERAAFQTENQLDQLEYDKTEAEAQRDAAMLAQDEAILGKSNLTMQRDTLQNLATQLQSQLETIQAEKIAIKQANATLQTANQQLGATITNLEMNLATADRNSHLETYFQRIDEVYQAQVEAGGPLQLTQVNQEIELLLPAVQSMNEEYRQSLASRRDELPTDEPIRITIDGLIEASETQSRHLERISKALQFHKELQTPYLHLIQQQIQGIPKPITIRQLTEI